LLPANQSAFIFQASLLLLPAAGRFLKRDANPFQKSDWARETGI
jgi:hypothetical protein